MSLHSIRNHHYAHRDTTVAPFRVARQVSVTEAANLSGLRANTRSETNNKLVLQLDLQNAKIGNRYV